MATRITLLVVEDEVAAREALGQLLRHEGYEMVLAANGKEAIDRIHGGPRPDLILLDMLMPVLDGWRFLARLRSEVPPPPIPVILTTGADLTEEWAKENGCQGILHKPIDAAALFEEVRRCLGGSTPAADAGAG